MEIPQAPTGALLGLDFTNPPKAANLSRVATKLFGLYATLGLMALFYSLIPEYIGGFTRATGNLFTMSPFYLCPPQWCILPGLTDACATLKTVIINLAGF